MASGKTLRMLLPFPKPTDNATVTADDQAFAEAVDNINSGHQDFLQAGVISSTDWSFTANIEAANGNLGSEGEVPASLAWLPDPVVSGALMRSSTAKAAIAKKALSSGSLPAVGKFACVAFELTPSTWGAAATVTTKAGVEAATQAGAEEKAPATTAGKIQVRQVVVEAKAGPTYAIVGAQKDVRPFVGPRVSRGFLSWGQIGESGATNAGSGDFTSSRLSTGKYLIKWNVPKANANYAITFGMVQNGLGTGAGISWTGQSESGFEVWIERSAPFTNAPFNFVVVATS